MTPKAKSLASIERLGACLVFPINNRVEPQSLWSALYPRSKMIWEWEEDSDQRVSDLWHLRERLFSSQKVVYSKWYKGRATFFSKSTFVYLLSSLRSIKTVGMLKPKTREILSALEDKSPLSTKRLKKEVGLKGKFFERDYTQSLKELWELGLIVGCGEIDDGAFPSLAIGATSLIFEDLWQKAKNLNPKVAQEELEKNLRQQRLLWDYFLKIYKEKTASSIPLTASGVAS